ncbi:MAG: sulfatase-like hydrolase/transferase [Myxococcales bacterium]|nr:sulfatase-like hydrolase/transferase [Myxococcales bacterium]
MSELVVAPGSTGRAMKWGAVGLFTLVLLVWLVSCTGTRVNILIVLIDDIGRENISSYGLGAPDAPPTPTISALAARGMRFDYFQANPICSPSRATLLTGKIPRHHGMTANAMTKRFDRTLADQPSFADVARDNGYYTFVLGKWHLAGDSAPMTHPLNYGFDYADVSRANLKSYYQWTSYRNGTAHEVDTYATTYVTDQAIDRVQSARGPWLGFVAYHAAHESFHDPPSELLSRPRPLLNNAERHRAMIEAMDTELERLLAALPANTLVFLLSDNGTPKAEDTFWGDGRTKGTPYQGGVTVPAIVFGPGVTVGSSDRLVGLIDIYATIAELVGSTQPIPANSRSLMSILGGEDQPLHRWMMVERHGYTKVSRAAWWGRCYKGITFIDPKFPVATDFALFDVCKDPDERNDLAPGLGADGGSSASPTRTAFLTTRHLLTQTLECVDFLDNDGDGSTDMRDAECQLEPWAPEGRQASRPADIPADIVE